MNNGENDLDKLLRTLRPVLAEDKYVYCHEASSQDEVHEDEAEWHALRAAELKELDPFVSVKEAEGLTMVLREEEARRAGRGLCTRHCIVGFTLILVIPMVLLGQIRICQI